MTLAVLAMEIVPVIRRRSVLRREAPVSWPAEISAIRAVYPATSTISFILNVPRSTIISWEREGCMPNYEDGRALVKLAAICRNSVTRQS